MSVEQRAWELVDDAATGRLLRRAANESGLLPVGTTAVVRLIPVEEKIGSLYVPQESRERQQMAQIDAELIAVGPLAFSDGMDIGGVVRYWPEPRPKAGDRVKISRYAGQATDNAQAMMAPKAGDAPVYRIVQDKDVVAIVT